MPLYLLLLPWICPCFRPFFLLYQIQRHKKIQRHRTLQNAHSALEVSPLWAVGRAQFPHSYKLTSTAPPPPPLLSFITVATAIVLHAEKAAGFQFPNEWLRIVGGLGKRCHWVKLLQHYILRPSLAQLRQRSGQLRGRPLCSQRASGLLTDSLVCTACNQS